MNYQINLHVTGLSIKPKLSPKNDCLYSVLSMFM